MGSMDIRQPQPKDHPVRIEFSAEALRVTLLDGRIIAIPLAWVPLLESASQEQRSAYRLFYDGISWPELDVDISIAGMLSGVLGGDLFADAWAERFAALGFDPDDMLDTGLPPESLEDELTAVMTTAEAAEAFGISERTVRQSCERGYIPARQSGKTWLVRRRDAEARWRIGEGRQRRTQPTTEHRVPGR